MDFCVPPASLLKEVAQFPNLVVVRSLTPFYGIPGLRVGFAVVSAERGQRWQAMRDPWNVNTVAEQSALACLGDREFQAATRLWLPPARDRLREGLAKIDGLEPYASAANFVLVRCTQPASIWQEVLLRRHRIFVQECSACVGLGDRHLRIGVRPLSEQDRLLTALAQARIDL
ncbi:MAG: aminotransferase class I/II-fold pyridoxal phosphate-dependent enzyme [Oscillatoriales cyanobacterium SM2_1_8]|nr:aminotransferase class I/II-fold pyridoxal phosphate-dependent enzyme [Oscillatoriales cyanobacterium SM2_1_8]